MNKIITPAGYMYTRGNNNVPLFTGLNARKNINIKTVTDSMFTGKNKLETTFGYVYATSKNDAMEMTVYGKNKFPAKCIVVKTVY